jgi:hypothetical protein
MKLREIVAWSFLLLSLSFVVHVLPFHNSMINLSTQDFNPDKNWISHDYLKSVVRLHESGDPTFAKRPLTTKLILAVSENSPFSVAESFVLVQWVLLVLCGIALGLLANHLLQNRRATLISILAFYLSFSIVFLFFEPIYSYDEPLQYLFIFLAMLFFMQNKLLLFILSFALACVARESSLFLLPGLFFIQHHVFKIQWKQQWKTILSFFVVFGLYLVFRFYQAEALGLNSSAEKQDFMARFIALKTNFGGFAPVQNTIMSMLVVMLPWFYLVLWNRKHQPQIFKQNRRFYVAFTLAMLINTPIVLLLTNAREVRLFFLPILFLLPIAGTLMNKDFFSLFKKEMLLKTFRDRKNLFVLLGFTALNFAFTMLTFRFEYTTQKVNFFNEYLFLLVNLVWMHWFLSRKHSFVHQN